MNIFEIDNILDTEIEEIIHLQDILDDIEADAFVGLSEEDIDLIGSGIADAFSESDDDSNDDLTLVNYDDLQNVDTVHKSIVQLLAYKTNKLTEIESNLHDKLNSYSYHVKQLQADAELAKDEASRFSERASRATKKAAKRKELLIYILDKYGSIGKTGNKQIKTDKFNFWTVNRKSTDIDDEVFNTEDDAHFTKVTVKVNTRHALALQQVIEDWASVEADKSIKDISDNTTIIEGVVSKEDSEKVTDNYHSNFNLINIHQHIGSVVSIDKKAVGVRLKKGETIKGVKQTIGTSLTIR